MGADGHAWGKAVKPAYNSLFGFPVTTTEQAGEPPSISFLNPAYEPAEEEAPIPTPQWRTVRRVAVSPEFGLSLVQRGILPPKCKRATIAIEAGGVVTITAEYFVDESIVDAPWELIGTNEVRE